MNDLTPNEAAQLALAVIQQLRLAYKDNKQLSLASAATLMASLANPGIRQGDIVPLIGGLKDGAVSKQLDLLEGRGANSAHPRFVYKARNELNRKENDIVVTEQGEQFMRDLAHVINVRLRGRSG